MIAGTLRAAWGTPNAFPSLWSFLCENTSISGTLPASWGAPGTFSTLQLLYIDGTRFTGTLPDTWARPGAFQSLLMLGLWNTTLSGTIPPSWGSVSAFPRLQVLDLSHTRLHGPLPSVSNTRLGVLNLHNCNFSSDLDAFWSSSSPLLAASLADNALSGSLPSQPGALSQLTFLDLSSNNIEGTVPLSWLDQNSFLSHLIYQFG